jgi:DNA polymerase I
VWLAVDTETTGVHWAARPFMISFANRGEDGDVVAYALDLPTDVELSAGLLSRALWADDGMLVMHNARFDVRMLRTQGLVFPWHKVMDTHTMAHLLDEHRSNKLKSLAKSVLREETDEKEVLDWWRRRLKKSLGLASIDDVTWDMIPRRVLRPYARKDAEFTLRLAEKLWPQIENSPDLLGLYRQEMDVMAMLLDIESAGMKVDTGFAQSEVHRLADHKVEVESIIEEITGLPIGDNPKKGEFNPGSPAQLARVLKADGINIPLTEAGNYSVTHEFLQELDHPLATHVVELRKTVKLRSTYFMGMLFEVDSNGILHPQINQHGASTGRMSSGGSIE